MLFISCHCEDVATTYILDRLVSSLHSWCGKLFFLKDFCRWCCKSACNNKGFLSFFPHLHKSNTVGKKVELVILYFGLVSIDRVLV